MSAYIPVHVQCSVLYCYASCCSFIASVLMNGCIPTTPLVPLMGQPVYVPQANRQQRKKKRLLTRQNQSDHGSTRNRVIGPLTKAAMSSHHHTSNGRGGEGEQAGIAVSGQGIGGSQKHSASCNRERNRLKLPSLYI